MGLDKQQIELIGRSALEAELMRQGFEVARPHRDRGIDLIIYADDGKSFSAIPIQVKAATKMSFGAFQKYEKFKDLVLVFVWYATTKEPRFFFLTHDETVKFVPDIEGISWKKNKNYSWNYLSEDLQNKLTPYENRWNFLRNLLQK